MRVLRLQHLHRRRAGDGGVDGKLPRRHRARTGVGGGVPGGGACGVRRGRGSAARRDRVHRRRHPVAARRGRPGPAARRCAKHVRPGARRRGDHRVEPRIDVAGVLRRHPRGRFHPREPGHAVRGAARAGHPRPRAHAGPPGGGRPRGPSRRIRPRQPRPHLRHAGGVDVRPRRVAGGGAERGRRPRVGVFAHRRGGHRHGAQGPPRRAAHARRRRPRRPLRAHRRRPARRRLRLVRGLQLGEARRRVPAQHDLLARRRLVGRRPRRAFAHRRPPFPQRQAPGALRLDRLRRGTADPGHRVAFRR